MGVAGRILILTFVMLVLPAGSCGLRVKQADVRVNPELDARASFLIENGSHSASNHPYLSEWRTRVEGCGGRFRPTDNEFATTLPIQVIYNDLQPGDRAAVLGCVGEANSGFTYDLRSDEGFFADDVILEFQIVNRFLSSSGDVIPERIVVDMPGTIREVVPDRRLACMTGNVDSEINGRQATISVRPLQPNSREELERCLRSAEGLPEAERNRALDDTLRVRIVSRTWSFGSFDAISLILAIVGIIPLLFFGIRWLVGKIKKAPPAPPATT